MNTCLSRKLFGFFAVLVSSAMVLTIAPSFAGDDSGRYTMQRTEDGMLRLDTRTGAMALCRSRDGAWACARIEDDSAGLETKIRDLKAENRKLRDQLTQLGAEPDTLLEGGAGAGKRSTIPSEEEVDRAFSFLEGVIKRFKGMVQDLNQTPNDGTPL